MVAFVDSKWQHKGLYRQATTQKRGAKGKQINKAQPKTIKEQCTETAMDNRRRNSKYGNLHPFWHYDVNKQPPKLW